MFIGLAPLFPKYDGAADWLTMASYVSITHPTTQLDFQVLSHVALDVNPRLPSAGQPEAPSPFHYRPGIGEEQSRTAHQDNSRLPSAGKPVPSAASLHYRPGEGIVAWDPSLVHHSGA